MKAKYLLMSLMLLVLAACQDESLIENKPAKGIKVYATTNNNDATRLTFTEGDGVTYATWEGMDGIGLFSEIQSNLCYRAPYPTESKKEFTSSNGELLSAEEGETIYAYYPYYENPPIEDDLQVRCNLYSECWYEGSRVGANPFMYASGVVNNGQVSLQFKHLYAYIKLTLTPEFIKKTSDDTSIKRISLNSTEDISLYNGVFDLEKQEIVSDESKQKYKNFFFADSNCPDVSSSAFVIYLQVLPQTENALVKIDVTTKENGDVCSISRKAPKGGLKAGHVYSLNAEKEEIGSIEDEMREALIEFYKATNGDNWTNNTNWCSDKPITEWYGISERPGSVYYSVDLSFNNLEADLNDCLRYLYGLPIELLYLHHNNITGYIPEDIDRLAYIANLSLGDNDISGEIPEGICNLQNLYYLHIAISKISGEIPRNIGNLKNLQFLCLANTNLSGTIPESICELTNLRELNLNNTGLGSGTISGEIPENIGNLVNLGQLTLENNQLTGNLPVSMSKLTKCPDCVLYGNKLSGEIPVEVSSSSMFPYWIATIMEQQEGYELTIANQYYTSTDFSKDKEVTLLQKHSKGNGIPIIIMGEAFVDKDMDTGGLYEITMKKGMEAFFSKEPTKSLRDYFDVYCIKAVSSNDYLGGNTALGIGFGGLHLNMTVDYEKCIDYAKVVREDLSNVPVIVMVNTERFIGVCHHLGDRFSLSFVSLDKEDLDKEDLDGVISHEAVGHGLSYLGDEYVLHATDPMTEEEKLLFRKEQEETGWALNIDITNDPEKVRWSKFIKDERYKDEKIGIFEGGLDMYRYGVYRPTEWSIMSGSETADGFSAPQRELIYKRVMELAYGDSWTYDYETFVEWDLAHKPATRGIAIPQTSGKQSTIKHLPPVILDYPSSKIGKHKDITVPLR